MPLLTKSRFKIALECTTKLYYHNHPELYANRQLEDPFLQALADGGFQVGELAKKYYPSGTTIESLDPDKAIAKTAHLLLEENAIIFEAAFKVDESCYVKGDIVVKEGKQLQLIEVKAKSYSSSDKMIKDDGPIASGWKQYLFDLCFQYWVVKKAHPELHITPYLMLVNKDQVATVDGLHQMFKIKRTMLTLNDGTTRSVVEKYSPPGLTIDHLGEKVLYTYNALREVELILSQENFEETGQTFEEYVKHLAHLSNKDIKKYHRIGKSCKGCEFVNDGTTALKRGMEECWQKTLPGLSKEDFARHKFFDIWRIWK